MKKKLLILSLLVLALVGLYAFRSVQPSITGRISPADGAEGVWAISTTDSAQTAVSGGAFSLTVKPGTYKVIIDAKEPRKDVVLDNVEVKDQPVDLGEIVLQ